MYATGNSSQVAVFVSTAVSSTGFMASVTAAPVGGVVWLVDIVPSRIPEYGYLADHRVRGAAAEGARLGGWSSHAALGAAARDAPVVVCAVISWLLCSDRPCELGHGAV